MNTSIVYFIEYTVVQPFKLQTDEANFYLTMASYRDIVVIYSGK